MNKLSPKSKDIILKVINKLDSCSLYQLMAYSEKLELSINDITEDKTDSEKKLLLQYAVMLSVSDNITNCYKLLSLELKKDI